MAKLKGQDAEIVATIQITRAATGKVENYEVKGTLTQEQLDSLKENENGSNTSGCITSSSD